MNSSSINVKGRLLDMERSLVMGILNITPDSFYDGGHYNDSERAILARAEQMLEQGADILDIGGMSSRPGAEIISTYEEKSRVLPVIQSILKEFPETVLSIDTIHGEVAKAAIGEGAAMINDISGGKLDEKMYPTVAELNVPYILMHMRGTPKTMQTQTIDQDPVMEILDFFIQEIFELRKLGVKDIWIDPGFGFGKTLDQNYEILNRLGEFKILDVPILVGLSRKSMIYKLLGTNSEQALIGTTALNMAALSNGANVLRVHDVQPAKECIRIYNQLSRNYR